MPFDVPTLVERLSRGRVLVVGDLVLDRHVWGAVERVSPEAPIQVLAVEHEEDSPGGAANGACKVAERGGRAGLAGVVGPDDEGPPGGAGEDEALGGSQAVDEAAARGLQVEPAALGNAQLGGHNRRGRREDVVRGDRADDDEIDAVTYFRDFMDHASEVYQKLKDSLGEDGESANQDARYVLPNAAETKIFVTMNARELFHFFGERLCKRAQWEIRATADEMLRLVKEVSPLIFSGIGPKCVQLGKCPEGKKTCGLFNEMKAKYK